VTCATGWVQNGENCYYFPPWDKCVKVTLDQCKRVTWDQCNAFCTKFAASYAGAKMLCIRNAADNSWIHYQAKAQFVWIGYTDLPPYGGGKGTKQYGWVTGCSSTYTNWMPGQPDNYRNEQDYAVQHPIRSTWDDTSKTYVSGCACEYKLA
jgi:hypothetical protein